MEAAVLENPPFVTNERASALEERVNTAMGLVNVATAELVGALAEVLRSGSWAGWGIKSPVHWVTVHCGVSSAHAARLVRLAMSLDELPVAAEAFAEGALSEDQVAVLCRHVDAAHDAQATELARMCTVSQLRRVLPGCPRPEPASAEKPPEETPGDDGETGGESEDPKASRRSVSFRFGEDGWWRMYAALPPDEGALMEKALEAVRNSLFRARAGDDHHDAGGEVRAGVELTWSDALVRMAEVALGNVEGNGRSPAERFSVILHADAGDPSSTRLHLGPALPSSLRRYLCCDTHFRVVLEHAGTPVAVLARARTVDDRMRVLIEQRDQGCRVPGCSQRRWLHIHHIRHHEDGGTAEPANLCALCPFHHRLHHRGRLGITGDPTLTAEEGLVFTGPGGVPIRGPSTRPPEPGATAAEAQRHAGLAEPAWSPPLGETLDERCIIWS